MHLVTFERRVAEAAGEAGAGPSMGDLALGYDTLEPSTSGARRLGALISHGRHAGCVVDLNRALAVRLAADDAGAPEAEADSLLPPEALAFLRNGARALDAARSSFDFAVDALERYDAPDVLRAGIVEPRERVRLCAPVPRPGKVLGVVRNYAAHAAEHGADAPEEPVLFVVASSAVIGPEDEILLPEASEQVDFEGELAVVVGRRARDLGVETALDCVAGYCAANDVTARDFQNTRGQRFIGKSCDTFAPLGPVLVTADEVPDPQDLAIRTMVSGEVVQSGHSKEMIFPVAEILAFASRLMTLEPGDVLLTGTPAGVGAARNPPRFLRDGDLVEVAVERVGHLRNYVRSLRPGPR